MAPKLLHYVWVGGRAKPKALIERIDRWRAVLVDFEIVEWNEANANIDANTYVREAYEARAFAFVSDYIRLVALEREGGIYVDTDVEVLKDLTPLLSGGTTFGFEIKHAVATSTIIAEPGCPFVSRLRRDYETRHFVDNEGRQDCTTNVARTTALLKANGLKSIDEKQRIEVEATEVLVLPSCALSPYDYLHNIDRRNIDTYTIHLFEGSWLSLWQRLRKGIAGAVRAAIAKLRGEQ